MDQRLLARHIGEFTNGVHQVEDRLVQITPDVFDNATPDITFEVSTSRHTCTFVTLATHRAGSPAVVPEYVVSGDVYGYTGWFGSDGRVVVVVSLLPARTSGF